MVLSHPTGPLNPEFSWEAVPIECACEDMAKKDRDRGEMVKMRTHDMSAQEKKKEDKHNMCIITHTHEGNSLLSSKSKVIQEELEDFMSQQVGVGESTCISQILTAFLNVGIIIKALPPGVFTVDAADVVKTFMRWIQNVTTVTQVR